MHNKRENSKAHKNQRTKILVFMANWAGEMFQHQNFEDHLELLLTLKQAYLDSAWANDRDERRNVLKLFEDFEELFKGIHKFDREDFRSLDHWILEQTKIAS